MERKSFSIYTMFPKATTSTKQSHEQQLSSNLTVPSVNKLWHRQASTNSDVSGYNPSPRSSTYALIPQRKFDFTRAQRCLQLELNRCCGRISKHVRFETKFITDFTRDLAQQLRRVIKPEQLNYVRYKIVVLVSIVQSVPSRQIHQSIAIASRSLWNPETDGSVTVQTKFGFDMFATATAFAIYTD